MKGKTRIGILGIGGVGGYFGGLLAQKYFQSKNIDIIFIARPSVEKIIKEKGLKLITPVNESIIFPALVSSDPNEIGELDYLICCIKSYDLEESLIRVKNCININTVILPLLNGVDAKERIRKIFPSTEIIDGCVYIVSRLIEPGVVKESGNIHQLYFGSKEVPINKLKELEKVFSDANIECYLSVTIERTIWEKFLFISSIASLTSYLNLSIGEILINEDHKQTLRELIKELKLIAGQKNITLHQDIVETTIAKMQKLPYETTSSMHSDFKKGGRTEYLSLTGYVVEQGRQLKIKTPAFENILRTLQNPEQGRQTDQYE